MQAQGLKKAKGGGGGGAKKRQDLAKYRVMCDWDV
jgi:hypothetical protein